MYQQKRKPQSNLRTSQPCASLVKAIAHTRMSVNAIASKQPYSVTGLCGVKLVLTPQQSGLVTDSDAERERNSMHRKILGPAGIRTQDLLNCCPLKQNSELGFWARWHPQSQSLCNCLFNYFSMLQPIRMLSACYALSGSSHGLAALHRRYTWTSSTGAAGTHKHIQCMVYTDMLYRSSRDS